MSYAALLSKIVSQGNGTSRRKQRLKSAMREAAQDRSFEIAERGSRSAGGDWFVCRLAEMKLDIGDVGHVKALRDAGHKIFKSQDGQGVLARALIMEGRTQEAEKIILDLILRNQSPDPLRLLRLLPPEPTLLDKACAAFQRSERTSYRKAIQASHLVEVAVATGDVERGLEITNQALRWLDGAKPERVTYSEPDRLEDLDKALADFHELMKGVGEFFLISGTLLGIKRENSLLEFDKDIDVGVFDPAVVERLAQAVGSSFAFAPDISSNIDGFKVKHRNGVVVDVFLHHVEGDSVWHGGPAHVWDNSKWWSRDDEKFETVAYKGRDYLAPADWDKYLTENYGDWRSPVRQYNASLEAPNRRLRDAGLARLYSRQNFVKYYHRADFQMLLRAMAAYEAAFGADAFLLNAKRVMLADSREDAHPFAATPRPRLLADT